MSVTRSIVIVGAGVFGLTAAWELAARGWQVTVIDPGPLPRPAAASTDISKVVRADYGADELYTDDGRSGAARLGSAGTRGGANRSTIQTVSCCSRLTRCSRGSFETKVSRCSSSAAIGSNGSAATRGPRDFLPGRRNSIQTVTSIPAPAGWKVRKVVGRLVVEAKAAGVRLLERTECDRLLEQDARVVGVRTTDGRELRADSVLVAAGAWTPALLPHLGDVMWATAQPVVHFRVENPAAWQAPRFPVWAADISRSGWYGFPALDDGTLKIANHGVGRRVHADDPRSVLPAEEARFRAFVRDHLPALASAPIVAARLCLYCDTFDGDFWIAHDPARAGLIVAAGDSGHAFKFAPVLGGLIADVIEEKPNAWAPRFRWRTRGRDVKEAARATFDS